MVPPYPVPEVDLDESPVAVLAADGEQHLLQSKNCPSRYLRKRGVRILKLFSFLLSGG